jgi:hypothetical protein
MNRQPSHATRGANGREADFRLPARRPDFGPGRALDETRLSGNDPRIPSQRWPGREGSGGYVPPVSRQAMINGTHEVREGRPSYGQGQAITVSVPALRTFVTLAAVVVLSVVLSVIATISVIAVMNAGVILPQYARLNQPTQVSQLGVCVSKSGRITTPTNEGFCRGGSFVHVQPKISRP